MFGCRFLTALVILTRVSDGITPRLATPDLVRALNPIASGGWPALIAEAAVVMAGSTLLHHHPHVFGYITPRTIRWSPLLIVNDRLTAGQVRA